MWFDWTFNLLVIPSAQQEARNVESVMGKIILKKSVIQSDKLIIRLGGKPMSVTLGPSMNMQSVLQKEI